MDGNIIAMIFAVLHILWVLPTIWVNNTKYRWPEI